MAQEEKSNLESLVEQGVKLLGSQETLNGVTVATAMATFFDLTDKQAAAIGAGYMLLADHLSKKEPGDGSKK
jgi:hypothetical protein